MLLIGIGDDLMVLLAGLQSHDTRAPGADSISHLVHLVAFLPDERMVVFVPLGHPRIRTLDNEIGVQNTDAVLDTVEDALEKSFILEEVFLRLFPHSDLVFQFTVDQGKLLGAFFDLLFKGVVGIVKFNFSFESSDRITHLGNDRFDRMPAETGHFIPGV